MEWLMAAQHLRGLRQPAVLITVASVRGHAPREAGAKMVVAADHSWGTVGGGNLEAVAISRARELLGGCGSEPELLTVALSDKARFEHGIQCCGGEVTILLEPLPVAPAVAIFGVGHVGLELARILARHDVDLHLIDSRPEQTTPERLAVLADARAQIYVHEVHVVPELVLAELPPGTHVLVMTHDHAEDAALCDVALRTPQLGSVGLIGSAGKWARFQRKLAEAGHSAEAIARITTPIGLPDIAGKDPATIALSVAAALIRTLERDRATAQTSQQIGPQAGPPISPRVSPQTGPPVRPQVSPQPRQDARR
jgi:xanthine dehydrogenase accessory factor